MKYKNFRDNPLYASFSRDEKQILNCPLWTAQELSELRGQLLHDITAKEGMRKRLLKRLGY